MARISVIMGVYNCKNKDMLLKSVQSIIDQTFKDWEFIICNDGSKDNTLDILNEISMMDSRIKVLSYSDNQGLAYALNYCVQHSTGEYIARQDDDDVSKEDRFEKQIRIIEKNGDYEIIGTCADVYDQDGIWGEYTVPEYPEKKSFLWSNPFMHPTIMMKKDALINSGGYRVAKETSRCEDYDLFMRMYAKGYKGYNIQEKLYYYYIDNKGNNKYRPMKYRIEESIVRFKGYKAMGILAKGLPYVIKPIIIGLIPQKFFRKIRKKQYS